MSRRAGASADWLGDGYFRCLGYVFNLRWDNPEAGRTIRRILGQFEIPANRVERRTPPTPNVPPVYSLSQTTDVCEVRYGNDLLFGPETFDEALSHLLWHINAEVGRSTGSYLLIHAGAIAAPSGDGMILPGDSGSGKTTLVAGLAEKGFQYLSDEAAAIDPVSRQLYPYAKPLTLKLGSLSLFPGLEAHKTDSVVRLQDQWFVQPEAFGGKTVSGPCSVRWVVSVRYQPDAPTRLEPISSGEAVMELGRRIMNLPQYGGRAFQLLADVARGAASYRLVSGDLREAVATLDGLARSQERS
ncbi:MAG TPA: hypothetical protein VFZ97_06375 [Acidimicrobiales bacterium]